MISIISDAMNSCQGGHLLESPAFQAPRLLQLAKLVKNIMEFGILRYKEERT